MVEALVFTCRFDVSSDLAEPIRAEADERFRATLAPSLNETERRRLRGSIEDRTIDHLQATAVSIAEFSSSS